MRFLHLLLICLFLAPLTTATERQITCKVVGISDGDTLSCLYNNKPLKVRLQYIDAPESEQPFGNRAKQALSALAFKKPITLRITGYDKYQRLLAVAFDGQTNINLAQVEQGMAWAYRETQPIYQQAQIHAQQKKIGLWRDPNPIEPADWRANKRSVSGGILQKKPLNPPLAIDCSEQKSCNQLPDYATAQRYFQQCGWKTLDGNNDGIPCNKLYRKAQRQ